jgi:pimeloyl-ACP methyl ester carboxylesterase
MSIYWDSRGEGPPILLIMGYGMSGKTRAPLRPNATMEEYAGCGHLYLIEDPRPLLGILEFVGRGAT